MSYRSLHISLLLILLGLDICMVNLAGATSFWLRCRTALFQEVDHQVINLTQDDKPIWGIRRRGKYREVDQAGGMGAWTSFENGPLTAGGSVDLLGGRVWRFEVDLGTTCELDRLEWRTSEDLSRDISIWVGTPELAVEAEPIVEFHADASLLSLRNFGKSARYFQIASKIPEDTAVQVSGFQVFGYDPNLPRILASPVIPVPQRPYEYLLVFWNIAALIGLLYCGAYRITRSLQMLDDLCIVMKAVALAAVSVIVILFLYRGYQEATYLGFEFSRLVVIIGAGLATVLLTLNRAIVDAIHLFLLKRGMGIRKVLIVGAGPAGQRIVERFRTHYWLAYEPVGFVDDNPKMYGQQIQGVPVLGGTDKLSQFAKAEGTDEVIVALPNSHDKAVRDIVGRCHSENLRFRILPDLFEIISADVQLGALDGVPVLDLEDHYLGQWDRFLKRGFDVTGAILGLIVLSPLLALLSYLIKISTRGPVLFVQSRVGENGKTFPFYKFRTMRVVTEEEDRKEREAEYKNLVQGGNGGGKIVNHERVTWVGRLMRRFSLDELPQIFNVLRGEMSFVGPRPPIPYEVASYNTWHMERFKGKPGITGLWQVSGRADLPFEEMVKLDLYYLKNWTLWLDFKVLLRTVPVVISGRGA